jgi:thiol-disulfide isomerase/thioredoxin
VRGAEEAGKGEVMDSRRFLHIVVVLVVLGLLGVTGPTLAACGSSAPASSSGGVEFTSASDLKLADHAGKPLVLNYFGSWCGPCNMEAPELSSFAKSHPEAQLMGVAVDDTQSAVVEFMDKYGLTYPVAMDDGWNRANADGVTGVPTTIFYNAAGQEVDRIVGASTEAQFDLSYAKAQ